MSESQSEAVGTSAEVPAQRTGTSAWGCPALPPSRCVGTEQALHSSVTWEGTESGEAVRGSQAPEPLRGGRRVWADPSLNLPSVIPFGGLSPIPELPREC